MRTYTPIQSACWHSADYATTTTPASDMEGFVALQVSARCSFASTGHFVHTKLPLILSIQNRHLLLWQTGGGSCNLDGCRWSAESQNCAGME